MGKALWGGLVALSVLCGSHVARAACTKDTDCQGENVCEAGECVAPTPAPTSPSAPPASPSNVTAAPTSSPPRQVAPRSSAGSEPAYYFDDESRKPHKVRKRLKNPALLATGIVVSAVGVGMLIYGVVKPSDDGGHVPSPSGVALLGMCVMGAGIPMIVIGSRREPVPTTLGIAPWISPLVGGLQLQLRL